MTHNLCGESHRPFSKLCGVNHRVMEDLEFHKEITKKLVEEITHQTIACAIQVHKAFGPGLLENTYESAFKEELRCAGLQFSSQKKIRVPYRSINLDIDFRYDVVVEDLIICELKAVETLLPVHQAQLLSYLKLLNLPKGVLLNFHANVLTKGMKTFVSSVYAELPP